MSPSPDIQSAGNPAGTSAHRQPSGRRVGAPIHHVGRRRAAKFGAATAADLDASALLLPRSSP